MDMMKSAATFQANINGYFSQYIDIRRDGHTISSIALDFKESVVIISLKHCLKLGIFYDSLAGPIILFLHV